MMDKKKLTPRHIIIKRPKVKDKERLLKAREKKLVTGRLPDRKVGGRMGEEMRRLRSTNRYSYRIAMGV